MTDAKRRVMVAGNWKMNGGGAFAAALSADILAHVRGLRDLRCDVVVAPPFPWLERVAGIIHGHAIQLAGQDCAPFDSGAYTGDVSPAMLKEAGCEWVIVGHSERRALHGETSALVRAKAAAAMAAGLNVIICAGEDRATREKGAHLDFVARQVAESWPDPVPGREAVLAYEPVWAIGTGLTADSTQIAQMHGALRSALAGGENIRIVYGGSVNPDIIAAILATPDVDGVLVGGASLKAPGFNALIDAACAAG